MIERLADWIWKIIKEPDNWVKAGEALMKGIEGAVEWTQKHVGPILERMGTQMVTWASNGSNWENLGKAIGDAIVKAITFADDLLNGVAQTLASKLQPKIVDAIGAIVKNIPGTIEPNKPQTLSPDLQKQRDKAIAEGQGTLDSIDPQLMKSLLEKTKNTNLDKQNSSLTDLLTKGLPGAGAVTTGSGTKAPVNLNANQEMIKQLDQLKAYANTTTTQISSFFTTMESSIKLTMQRIGASFVAPFTPLQTHATQITSQTSATFVVMETSIKGTLTRIAAVFPTAFAALITGAQTATAQASVQFITMETSIKGTLLRIAAIFPTSFTQLYTFATQATGLTIGVFTTMQASIQQTMSNITLLFQPAFANLAPLATEATSLASAAFVTMYSSIQGTLATISTAINDFGTKTLGQMVKDANTNTSNTSATFVTMYNSIKGSLNLATNAIKEFAKTTVSELGKAEKAAKGAASAFDEMRKAAEAAAKAAAKAKSAGGAGQFGGVFATAQHGGLFFAQGGSAIVAGRRKIGGVTVGEWGKPEAIDYDKRNGVMTVTPLTDPSKIHDRGNGSMSQGSSNGGVGGNGSAIYNITLHINGNDIIDTQKIKKVIRAETGKNWSRHV